MADNNWFRIKRIGDGTEDDPYRPAHSDRVDAFSWSDMDIFGESPYYLARFYADEETLDEIADESDAQQIDLPVDRLNEAFGQERDEDGWRDEFRVGNS